MSLDTVLKIGKVFKNAEDNMKYFKYVESCPIDNKGNYPLCVTIPININNSINWNNVKITPENERDRLYYLKFKTSDSDGLVKYIYGDIYYEKSVTINKNGKVEQKEGGYYRLSNPTHPNAAYRSSSFMRGKSDYDNLIETLQKNEVEEMDFLRNTVGDNLMKIERLLLYSPGIVYYFTSEIKESFDTVINDEAKLKEYTIEQNLKQISKANLKKLNINPTNLDDLMKSKIQELSNCRIFLHFEYSNPVKKYWCQYKNQLSIISQKMLSEFVEQTNNGFVFKKTLYKTLCSGDSKNDIQFPNFCTKNKYKSKSFTNDEVQDLFYALSYTNKGKLIAGTDIKLIILPCGENLTKEDYETFLEKNNEDQIVANNSLSDSLFDFTNSASSNITSFDLIFCKKGGLSSPDKDLIEISGIKKSKLRETKERMHKIALQVFNDRKKFIGTEKDLSPLSVEYSFRTLLGNPLYDQKIGKVKFEVNSKYQSHLLKVLPQIYSDNYYNDEDLLSSFVQNNEYAIRFGDSKYGFLKYDLMLVLKIQNNKNDKYMEITESKSYQLGVKLGKLSKPLKKAIGSFEKNYVGLLTRRIATKDDCISFANDICEKLVMHEKMWNALASEVCSDLAALPISEYDKEKLAFGYFEGYFKYEPNDSRKSFVGRLEKVLSDYDGNKPLETELEQLNELVEQFNKQ